MTKKLTDILKELHLKHNYELVSLFFNDSFIFFEDLEDDFDYFIDCIEDIKTETILLKLKLNNYLTY